MRGVEFSTVLRTVALGCVLAVVVACAETYRNSGYIPSEDELAQVQVGKSDRAFVEETVGRPITQAAEPLKAATDILAEIAGAKSQDA